MKRRILFALAAGTAGWVAYTLAQNPAQRPAGSAPPPRMAIRIAFGERQDRETDYSGAISLSEGQVTELIPWRFFGADQVSACYIRWPPTRAAIIATTIPRWSPS
jgi:hypothetical protein